MANEVQRQIDASIQSQVRQERPTSLNLLLYMTAASSYVPGWWSKARDSRLREFWKNNDYLSGAVYSVCSRMATIPLQVLPWDENSSAAVEQANRFERILLDASEFGMGMDSFITKWVEDLTTQDNGAFGEVIGEGDPEGPIVGQPYGVAHLDSARCDRTSSPEFPVIYTDISGKRFRLHHTRVMYASLQPSPIAEMMGVGFSSISRCINTSQHLMDVLTYKQEKLGSRPTRGIIVTKGGLDPADVQAAMEIANEAMDSQALNRYSKMAVVGSGNLPEAGLDMVQLSSLPDGFDEQQSTTIGMAAIALAFGVDPRELWPGLSVGSTRAEALVAHLKARTKGIGQIIAITERVLSQKFLPPTLYAEFDYQDDSQDRQVADIRQVRTGTHEVALRAEMLDVHTVRQQMVADGDLSQAQYEALELQDGRLPDGAPVVTLFAVPEFRAMLNLGVPDPLLLTKNEAKPLVAEKRAELMKALGTSTNFAERQLLQQGLRALDALLEEVGSEAAPAPEPPAPEDEAEGGEPMEEEQEEEAEAPADTISDDEALEEGEYGEDEMAEDAVA